MINARMEINGEIQDVQLFDNMFDYVTEYGSDISDYTIGRDSDKEFIVDEENFTEDINLHTFEEYEINGENYIRVNWGENEISLIKESGIGQTLYSIYQRVNDHEYRNYQSRIFETEEKAQAVANGLNGENDTAEKEFMCSVPDSILVAQNEGEIPHYIAEDDTIFNLSLKDFFLELENNAEFYKNRTPETMQKVLNKYLESAIETLKADAGWYIKVIMPVFLKDEFRRDTQ